MTHQSVSAILQENGTYRFPAKPAGWATDSPSDAVALFPNMFPNVNAARVALQRHPAASRRLIKRFLQFMPPATPVGPFVVRRTKGDDDSTQVCNKSNTDLSAVIPGQTPLEIVTGELWEDGEWPAAQTLKYRRAGSRANRPSLQNRGFTPGKEDNVRGFRGIALKPISNPEREPGEEG